MYRTERIGYDVHPCVDFFVVLAIYVPSNLTYFDDALQVRIWKARRGVLEGLLAAKCRSRRSVHRVAEVRRVRNASTFVP